MNTILFRWISQKKKIPVPLCNINLWYIHIYIVLYTCDPQYLSCPCYLATGNWGPAKPLLAGAVLDYDGRKTLKKPRHVLARHWHPSNATHFLFYLCWNYIIQVLEWHNTRVEVCQFTRIPMTRLNVAPFLLQNISQADVKRKTCSYRRNVTPSEDPPQDQPIPWRG